MAEPTNFEIPVNVYIGRKITQDTQDNTTGTRQVTFGYDLHITQDEMLDAQKLITVTGAVADVNAKVQDYREANNGDVFKDQFPARLSECDEAATHLHGVIGDRMRYASAKSLIGGMVMGGSVVGGAWGYFEGQPVITASGIIGSFLGAVVYAIARGEAYNTPNELISAIGETKRAYAAYRIRSLLQASLPQKVSDEDQSPADQTASPA